MAAQVLSYRRTSRSSDDWPVDELQFHIVPSSWYGFKPFTSRLLAGLLLVPGLPLMGFLILLVRLTSPGPGVYRQRRIGKNGCCYWMYKIRTMRQDAESRSGAVWAQPNDPRVTWLGYWLRKLHLDELPQLINVLRGEMTLIGPRPERPEFIETLVNEVPGYLDRISVAPGVTGLAQINLPPDTDFDSVRRKLVLDREYIAKASMWLDLRILGCTLCRAGGIPGDTAMRLFLLQRKVSLPEPVRLFEEIEPEQDCDVFPASIADAGDTDSLELQTTGSGIHRRGESPEPNHASQFGVRGSVRRPPWMRRR